MGHRVGRGDPGKNRTGNQRYARRKKFRGRGLMVLFS